MLLDLKIKNYFKNIRLEAPVPIVINLDADEPIANDSDNESNYDDDDDEDNDDTAELLAELDRIKKERY